MRLSRPWANEGIADATSFGPADCLLSLGSEGARDCVELMPALVRGKSGMLVIHPYPSRRSDESRPDRCGFPVRPRSGQPIRTSEEEAAHLALHRMNEVLARVQELGEALDNPAQVWPRLRNAWERAGKGDDPRMAEIVRQARELTHLIRDFPRTLRRILRRSREKVVLDRVQEMDRGAMLWLARQPGRTVAERAGSDQRIMATVRRENYDTLENRVLNAYSRLAADVAREWLAAHEKAQTSQRYQRVAAFRSACKALSHYLDGLGVGIADRAVTPNYVLMQNADYRAVLEAWRRLIERERVLDDLWAWQAETWTDFCVLAIVLALEALPDSSCIAQSPIAWQDEAVTGRWFRQDRPIAVFWLREADLVVEVLARPGNPSTRQKRARATVSLKISALSGLDAPRRVLVWTPHAMTPIEPAGASPSDDRQ